ncbi:unnamed protein product, partial [Brugia pahangi]|uniref:MFS_1_like domain-containing protein n=1 Tax=Brugia pahangi TaxID=6280 RepID=A0A158PQF5_BRUPA
GELSKFAYRDLKFDCWQIALFGGFCATKNENFKLALRFAKLALYQEGGFDLGKSITRIRLHINTSFTLQTVRMVWPFNSTKPPLSSSPNSSHSETQSTSLPDLAVIDSAVSDLSDALDSSRDSTNMISLDRSPIFALDQLKQAGVPFEKQLSPYLQMDPTCYNTCIFMYIVPGESKGELEFAMGRIGWAVLGGYALGSVRGILPELRNPNTRQLVRTGFAFFFVVSTLGILG